MIRTLISLDPDDKAWLDRKARQERTPMTRLVRRGIRLSGSYGCRVRTDMPDVLRLAGTGQINVTRPITRRYTLEQADEAYQALNRGEIVGRAIVVME